MAGGRRILIADANSTLIEMLSEQFQSQKEFDTYNAVSAAAALQFVEEEYFDAIILGTKLSDMDGYKLCQLMRRKEVTSPIIILVDSHDDANENLGVQIGATDYMVKPFAFVELLARIDTICRRPATRDEVVELVIGELRMDLLTREAARDGQRVDLQPREFLLLKHFMERPGRVQTRTVLLESVWGLQFDPKTSVVETHISRLRNKIDKPFDKHYLVTLHGVGYVLQP